MKLEIKIKNKTNLKLEKRNNPKISTYATNDFENELESNEKTFFLSFFYFSISLTKLH